MVQHSHDRRSSNHLSESFLFNCPLSLSSLPAARSSIKQIPLIFTHSRVNFKSTVDIPSFSLSRSFLIPSHLPSSSFYSALGSTIREYNHPNLIHCLQLHTPLLAAPISWSSWSLFLHSLPSREPPPSYFAWGRVPSRLHPFLCSLYHCSFLSQI